MMINRVLYVVICAMLLVILIFLYSRLYRLYLSVKPMMTIMIQNFINLSLIRLLFHNKKKYKKIDKIDNFNVLAQEFDRIDNHNESNVVITLTTIPTRLVGENILIVIDSLYNQTLRPKIIVLNVCVDYKRYFHVKNTKMDDVLRLMVSKYENLVINYSCDYGPITKILGLTNLSTKKYMISDDDIVIVVDDDYPLDKNMVYHHVMCHQLYGCDYVFVDEKKLFDWVLFKKRNIKLLQTKSTYYDNYQGICYGWLTYSMKWYCLDGLKTFYEDTIKNEPDAVMHDDLIMTLWYKHKQYYSCGINLMFNIMTDKIYKPINQDLYGLNSTMIKRALLEKRLLNKHNIAHSFLRNQIYDNRSYRSLHIIKSDIKPRYMLANIESMDYEKQDNFHNLHVDLKHHNYHTIIITVTFFTHVPDNQTICLELNDQKYIITLPLIYYSKKQSFFVLMDNVQEQIPTQNIALNHKLKIIQTSVKNDVSLYRYYSVSTILTNIPHIPYKFFNNTDVDQFISDFYPRLISTYRTLNPGAYKADMFRAMYLYKNGGLYFDCKQILFGSIVKLLIRDYLFVRDTHVFKNYVCNAFLYSKNPALNTYKNYLSHMIINIHNRKFCDDPLQITGPGLLGKYVTFMCMNNTMGSLYDRSRSYITMNDKIMIKNTYNGYYNENNYITKGHYRHMWQNKQVYTNYLINIRSDLIKHVAWINFDSSERKKNDMIDMLRSIFIPTTRISAVNRKYNETRNNILSDRDMHLLSHIKAITYLSTLDGEYFMILEDWVTPDNSILLTKTLDQIIQDVPESDKDFDILLLQKIYCRPLEKEYTSWNYLYNKFISDHVAGTGAYIISKKGVIKFVQDQCTVDNNNVFVNKCKKPLKHANIFIYSNLKTIIYKYNYFEIIDRYSSPDNSQYLHHNTKSSEYQLRVIVDDMFN